MNNNDSTNVTLDLAPASQDEAQFHLGFERVEALVRAVPAEDLEPINLEVPSTVATVLGAYPEIVALRPELLGLSTFNVFQIDRLRDFALALGHTHAEFRAAGGTADNVGAQAAECLEIRDRFHADATALAKRGLVDEARVSKLRGGNSYRMIAFDIVGLAAVFLERWPAIAGKTALETTEIEDARRKANQLVAAIGLREQAEPAVSEVSRLRQQAYTLLVRAYNDTRDAIAFVRRAQGDVDKIAPSLYAGRARRSGSAENATAPSPAAPPVAALEDDATSPAIALPVGFPGGSPIAGE